MPIQKEILGVSTRTRNKFGRVEFFPKTTMQIQVSL